MKKILMISCNSGIGKAVLDKIINYDFYIYLTVHTDLELLYIKEKYSNYSNIEFFKLDITKDSDLIKLDNLKVDIMINMSAIGYGGSILDLDMSKIRENFEVNVFSYINVLKKIIRKMIINNKGKIIVIGSLASFLSFKFLGVYSATKASLNSIIISLQKELNLINSKVRVILVEPGMYHSGFNQVMLENKFDIMNNGFFKDEINLIRKKENFLFSLIEKREFDSIVCAIICAIKYDSILVYRAPLFQSLFAKIYNFFRS